MKLHIFLQKRGLTASDCAEAIDRPPSVVTRLLNGDRGVSLETAIRIEAWTKGLVTPKDLLGERP